MTSSTEYMVAGDIPSLRYPILSVRIAYALEEHKRYSDELIPFIAINWFSLIKYFPK